MNKRRNTISIFIGLAIGFITFYPFTYSSQIGSYLVGVEEISPPNSKMLWRTTFDQSTYIQSIWTRTYMAFNGLLNSIRPEVIYLQAMLDEEGNSLQGKSSYVIQGHSPKCRYWSIAIYNENQMINPINESIKNNFNTDMDQNGNYKIFLSDSSRDINHINHQGNDFTVIMRIYGPDSSYYTDPQSIPVAIIRRQGN